MSRPRGHDHDRHQAASFERRARAGLPDGDGADREEPLPCPLAAVAGLRLDETAEVLSFSTRWLRILIKRYNEGGPSQLGDQRANNGTEPTILTPAALDKLKERLQRLPDDGGQWTGPKIARWLAGYHGLESVHDQRGWDALVAIGYSIQQPRPQHPDTATEQDRTRLKKSSSALPPPSAASIPTPRSRSGRRTSIA